MSETVCAPPSWTVEPGELDDCARAVRELGMSGRAAAAVLAASSLERARRDALAERIAASAPPRVLHADQVVDLGGPLTAGERVTCAVHVESLRYFSDYEVLCLRGTLTDAAGVVRYADSTTLLTRVGAGCSAAPDGPSSPRRRPTPSAPERAPRTDFRFEQLRVGAELPTRVCIPGGLDIVTDLAEPGSLSATDHALVFGYLTDWLGDPAALLRLRAQRAPNLHRPHRSRERTPVTISGRVTALDARKRTATVGLDLRTGDRRLAGHLSAEVRVR
ncbi:hypothetical protein IU433_01560 [Nocardia puris]|uniref:MaoC dehydratase-like protein n=1 Tax=Nocardia puris TaxID=208602 RepID=A0A366DWI2_9NOCA|nr:hypothetical protein [Nocardia puris]MBF6210473.1 hypothetical protein [Nocardia puris]MBF6367548.1 hypothetical protein [Nocardia puris]MBF6457733.1 hypothetical protein [Nocardia puris]RBO93899.1 hypothetical protein DFR74_102319 [Nocardia puris]